MFEITDISGTVTLWNGVRMPYFGLGVYQATDGNEVINAIHWAFDAGYRLIDTASLYENEAGVGEAVRSSKLPREEIFVTTKVWNSDQGYDNTIKAFNKSLKLLGLEYVDLYLIHWPVKDKYKQTWKALETLYKEGKVKAIGVSNFLIHHLKDIFDIAEIKPMVNQVEFHPWVVDQPLLDFCHQQQIHFQAWSPLIRGEVFNIPLLQEIGKKYNKNAAQITLRWNLQKGVLTIPKSVRRDRIISNAQIFDFNLTASEIAQIDALNKNYRIGAHPDNFDF